MTTVFTVIATILAAITACSDGEFSGANGLISKKEPIRQTCVPTPDKECNKPPIETDDEKNDLDAQDGGSLNQIMCVKNPEGATYRLGVPAHRDSHRHNSTNLPQADVMESAVIKFDFNSLQGNLLNVTRFSLDDIVFIVKDTDKIETVANGRTISIPSHALMLYNASDPNFASGAVDSTAATVYKFPGKADIRIPAGKSTVRAVYKLGVPLISHKAIKLTDLKDKGFVDAAGNIAFKLMHVAHGIGSVAMSIHAEPCK